MANTKSALKRIRQTATRTARNRAVTSKLKTLRKSCRCGGNVRQGSRCCCLQHFLLSR